MIDPFLEEMKRLPKDHPTLALLESADKVNMKAASGVGGLVRVWYSTRDSLATLEKLVEETKRRLAELEEDRIPQAMFSAGLKELRLRSGEKLVLVDEVYASIPDTMKTEAWRWMEESGHGDMLRNDFRISLGKGQEDAAQETERVLVENDIQFERQTGVHWKTLQSFVRQELEEGRELPPCIRWHRKEKVKIKS